MAVLTKQDLRALFILLAIAYLFDSIFGNFLIGGVIVFLIIAGVAWFNKTPELINLVKGVGTNNNELIVRVSVAAVLIGILLQSPLAILIGLLVGVTLVLLPIDTLKIDLWTLTVPEEPAPKPDNAPTKRPDTKSSK